MKQYVIIGANAAGLSAAVRIKKHDANANIIVLEKSEVISFGACGIPYYISGEFNDINQMTARSYEDFIKLGITIKNHHEVIAIDFEQKIIHTQPLDTTDNYQYPYDILMIASGATPIMPNIDGLEGINYLTMHSQSDAIKIKSQLTGINKIAILGGGFIGLEAAEAFGHLGKEVHLIDKNDRVLARTFDKEITPHLENSLKKHGITLHQNQSIQRVSVSEHPKQFTLTLNDTVIEAELLIIAIGFKPNTAFIKDAKLLRDDNGAILINEFTETSIKDVYAAGDCATVKHRILKDRYIPLATTANKLGRLAGDNMALASKPFIGTLGASAIRVFDMEAARVGITEQEAINAGIEYKTVFIQDKNRTDYVPPQTNLFVKLIYDAKTRILLGGQLCGSYGGGAVGRINALSVAIYSQLTVDELGMMDFVYAPPFSRTWDALNIAGNVAK